MNDNPAMRMTPRRLSFADEVHGFAALSLPQS